MLPFSFKTSNHSFYIICTHIHIKTSVWWWFEWMVSDCEFRWTSVCYGVAVVIMFDSPWVRTYFFAYILYFVHKYFMLKMYLLGISKSKGFTLLTLSSFIAYQLCVYKEDSFFHGNKTSTTKTTRGLRKFSAELATRM